MSTPRTLERLQRPLRAALFSSVQNLLSSSAPTTLTSNPPGPCALADFALLGGLVKRHVTRVTDFVYWDSRLDLDPDPCCSNAERRLNCTVLRGGTIRIGTGAVCGRRERI